VESTFFWDTSAGTCLQICTAFWRNRLDDATSNVALFRDPFNLNEIDIKGGDLTFHLKRWSVSARQYRQYQETCAGSRRGYQIREITTFIARKPIRLYLAAKLAKKSQVLLRFFS
jgi:hypothetical protein